MSVGRSSDQDKTAYNTYMREYMLERYKSRISNALDKLGGKCKRCKSTDNLQFDHIDPSTKKFALCKLWSLSEEKFQIELKKCQLLCQECHAIKSITDAGLANAKITHGTISSYRYCKCDLCKAAKSKSNREYKLNKTGS